MDGNMWNDKVHQIHLLKKKMFFRWQFYFAQQLTEETHLKTLENR